MGWKDNLETTFKTWAKPASDTEETRCNNALRMIKEAVQGHEAFKDMSIEFIPQGSYHNNTNVRLNSDVDICVRLTSVFFCDYPEGMGSSDFGNTDSSYSFSTFKATVKDALVNKFGSDGVIAGNKSFKIHSNTYRVDADAVPCFEHRRYNKNGGFIKGTQFYSSKNEKVINFPEQHYENGVGKNNETGRKYKRVVRILKRVKAKMVEEGHAGLENVSSFLIECLVWNAPNYLFTEFSTYTDIVKHVLAYLWENTKEDSKCKEWGEVSELLYLFRSSRPYTRQEVNNYLLNTFSFLFS